MIKPPMNLLSRRTFVQFIGASYCVLNGFGSELLAEVPTNATLADSANRGRRFLESLFDRALDLLPEYRGAKVYWLFHDNYLAAKMLAHGNPELADKIKKAIHRFGSSRSGKIEILFGEAKQPLPFRQYELTEVRRIGDKTVKTEVVKDTILQDWQQYADLLFLAAIAETDHDLARKHLDEGFKFWNGTGFMDRVAATNRQYATYKLALALIAVAKLNARLEPRGAIIERLLAQQGEDGGWITDYDFNRKPIGRSNVETTSLAILALHAVVKTG
jgi:hypothetical protein